MYLDEELSQLYQLIDKKQNQKLLEAKTNQVLQDTVLFQQEIIGETQRTINQAIADLRKGEQEFYGKFDNNVYEAIAQRVVEMSDDLAQKKVNGITNDPLFQSQLREMVLQAVKEILT